MVTLETWRQQMSEDMRLHDLRERTRQAYLLAARQFFDWKGSGPETVTEDDVRRYFLYLREDKKLAPSSINIAVYALRFFFAETLQVDWKVFSLLRVNMPRKLPVVLSRDEVRKLLGAVRQPVRRMALTTIYAMGLRINEALSLETSDIDSARLMVWIRDGKGARDRGVPLPRPILARLRHYWKHERPASETKFLFVARDATAPLDETTLQKTLSAVRQEIKLDKHAVVHTLRHSYATHLLEAGISLRTIQQLLGHKSLRTTELYMHITKPGAERLQETLDRLMANL